MEAQKRPSNNRAQGGSKRDSTKEDYECPICMLFIAEPIKTPCEHLFCLSCHKEALKYKTQCPLCRGEFNERFQPIVDLELQKELIEQFPDDFEKRKNELIKNNTWQGNKIPLRFAFGNLHS